jgi:uncharacterized protein YggU (UPF0235/DUF167 family)
MGAAVTRVRLRVSPRAAGSELVGRHGAAWKLRVAAPPEGGRANDAATALVADALAVPRSDVKLVAGASSRDKVVEIAGLGAAEVDRRLSACSVRRHG